MYMCILCILEAAEHAGLDVGGGGDERLFRVSLPILREGFEWGYICVCLCVCKYM